MPAKEAGKELSAFMDHMKAAQTWCAIARNYEAYPWSPELEIPRIREELKEGIFTLGSGKAQKALVDRVLNRRSILLSKGRLVPDKDTTNNRGRLLVFECGRSTAHGLSEAESNGFFDRWDCPGWDTWVYCQSSPHGNCNGTDDGDVRGALFCWVPAPFVQKADAGINANPEMCILWADDLMLENWPIIQGLRERGLLAVHGKSGP